MGWDDGWVKERTGHEVCCVERLVRLGNLTGHMVRRPFVDRGRLVSDYLDYLHST